MLAVRLQRVQADLQAHRQWLKCFAARSSCLAGSHEAPRTFTTSHRRNANDQKAAAKKAAYGGKARTAWQRQIKQKVEKYKDVKLEALSQREDLLRAVTEYDIQRVIALYHELPQKKPLTDDDVLALAQCVHQCLRLENQKSVEARRRDDVDQIVDFAIQIVKDIRKERLLPSTAAHAHLLGVFKESGTRDAGFEFWQWLEMQDDEHVNLDVYAVAIDFLAINGHPLDQLEELYDNALARFPGTFYAYHLSPEAILPDREGEIGIKRIPMNLLQSITRARLIRGETQKAYLALDTAFRLYPNSVADRFFAIFKDERPVSEWYTIHAMACRAGIVLPEGYTKALLAQLRLSSDLTSASRHVNVLRAMLAVLYFKLASSGTISSNSMSEVISGISQCMRLPGFGNLKPEQRKQATDAVMATIRTCMEILARYGVLPATSAFNNIITNIAGHGHAKELLEVVATDMHALGVEQNDVTRRCFITAAGLLKDPQLVDQYWRNVVAARRGQGRSPDITDFNAFIKAARFADCAQMAQQEWETYKHQIDSSRHSDIEHRLNKSSGESIVNMQRSTLNVDELLDGVRILSSDLDVLDSRTRDSPIVMDLSNQDLPMTLLSMDKSLHLPEAELRRLYDELTTEQRTGQSSLKDESLAPTASAPTSLLSTTNIPFGELRYHNWKTINHLLWLSGKHDGEYNAAVDRAINTYTKPPARNMGLTFDELDAMKSVGLGAPDRSASGEDGTDVMGEDVVRSAKLEILRLRGRA